MIIKPQRGDRITTMGQQPTDTTEPMTLYMRCMFHCLVTAPRLLDVLGIICSVGVIGPWGSSIPWGFTSSVGYTYGPPNPGDLPPLRSRRPTTP